MSFLRLLFILTAGTFGCVTFTQAQDAAVPKAKTDEPVVIGHKLSLHSETLKEERKIQVSTPAGYEDGEARYGVVYLLDGPGHFAHTTANIGHLARNSRALPLIVVAVGNTDRTRDMTPPPPAEGEAGAGRFPTAGGSANFRRFLVDELRPFIDARYRTSGMNILIGHSFGGLFAVHTMLEEPESFSAYFALSPSLWWNSEKLVGDLKEITGDHGLFKKFVYLAMGEEGATMNPPFEAAVWALRDKAPADFAWKVGRFLGEDHGSLPLPATQEGLRALFAPVREAADFAGVTDLAVIDARFAALSKRYGMTVAVPVELPVRMGFLLMSKDQLQQALAVFDAGLVRAPDYTWCHLGRGEALEKLGRLKEALETYERGHKIGIAQDEPGAATQCQTKLEALRERIRATAGEK